MSTGGKLAMFGGGMIAMCVAVGVATATITNVSPGLNALQTPLNAAAASGDTLLLANGTYTFNTTWGLIFDSSATGTTFTNLTVMGAERDSVIMDFSGVTSGQAFYGGNSSGVKIRNMTWLDPTGGSLVRDHADSQYRSWLFQDIKLDTMTVTPFLHNTGLDTSLTIRDIVTTARFSGPRVIDIRGLAADTLGMDLLISGIDARLNDGTVASVIRLIDVRDARIRDVWTKNTTSYGIQIRSEIDTLGVYDIDVTNVNVDTSGGVAIHVGNTANRRISKRVRLHSVYCNDSAAYGFEFENGAEDCELVNFRTLRTVSLGVALAEDTKNILVSDGFIDTVTGNPLGQGVAMVWGRRHRVLRNVIANCLTAAFWHVEAGAFSVDNERNTIKDNIIYNCGVVYRVDTVAMPTGRLNQMIGPNTVFINTLTAYSNIDTVNRTQAEFEATYPTAIDASDVLVLDQPSTLYRYSEQQALNILAGNTTPPYTQYSKQQALNRIVGNTTGNPNKYGSQFVTNALIGNN